MCPRITFATFYVWAIQLLISIILLNRIDFICKNKDLPSKSVNGVKPKNFKTALLTFPENNT
jgi:hypothetical protein